MNFYFNSTSYYRGMKKIIGHIFEYIWMFILLGFLWYKCDVKSREENLAKLYKPKDQVEVNPIDKKAYNKLSKEYNHYE